MTIWAAPALAAAAYNGLALVGAARWVRRRPPEPAPVYPPPISILKPVHGLDPRFYEAIVSHASQNYPEFEILFGVTGPNDETLAAIRRLRAEFPWVAISVRVVQTDAPNQKVGVLAELARHARYPILLVNDSDIVVEQGYLHAVSAPLSDPKVGLVTCLYRADARSWASRAEAIGIATEFAPSVLVARLLGVSEFALGSTMVFRAEALSRIGGFDAIATFLADDYQLGRRISELGYRIEFSPVVVATDLGAGSWRETWKHQLRWSRTIRVSRPSGYYGYVVTHATLWALAAVAAGQYWAAALALSMRMAAGMVIGGGILRDRKVLTHAWMIPLRDLFGVAVWLCGAFGRRVYWRDQTLELRSDGRICEEPQTIPERSS